jgi:hypothetical protein
VEYDFVLNEYTDWSRENSDKFPRQWFKQHTKILNCFYDKADSNKIVLHDEQYLTILNKNESMPENKNAKIFHQQLLSEEKENNLSVQKSKNDSENNKKSALHISNKYRVRI